jgi:DNA-binding MarR family transcriptional regulator
MIADPATNLPLLIAQGLSKISIALRSHAQQGATGEQLSPTQGQILNRVLLAGPQRLSTLSQDLAVSLPTVSDAVTTLVQKKLLTKQRDPQDARAQTVQLTRKGSTLATRTNQWPDFLASAVDVLSPEEQVLFHRAIIKIIRTMQDRGEIPVARMCVSCQFFQPLAHPGQSRPHHCNYVDAPLGEIDLRIDCNEFQPAPDAESYRQWFPIV